jgi:hypothetical protein
MMSSYLLETSSQAGDGPNFLPEPTAAAPLAFCVEGKFVAPLFRPRSVSGGCGSAER